MSKTQRAIKHFNEKELKELIRDYPFLKHLREAYAFKKDKCRVYVASPYDTLLSIGWSILDVENEAKKAMQTAKRLFNSPNFELFSPVLHFGRKALSRDEAMSLCFKELSTCDFFFVAKTAKFHESLGILAEFDNSLENDKIIVFENLQTKLKFERAWL
ncbi:hypothetical protein [Campylobacter gastrosuis]|uniref:Uncharacterized protein n=1 Tax=Campylobacter gastrosuis TaxID=2974576 RepID=A0ABT7HT42_9BACT|nr:hypothetical protein [Campylobacter gastrosuis]MDL0089927.1 hypothetical protein [Campylobacter gastrosuis]